MIPVRDADEKPPAPRLLSAEECADILVDSEIDTSLDLGHSFLYKLRHPALGLVCMVNSAVGHSGLLPC